MPENHLVLFEYKQMICSPGVWDVKVNLPSELYTCYRTINFSPSDNVGNLISDNVVKYVANIYPRQDNFVIRIFNLDMHSNPRA